jgi:uncharacterized protein
LCKMRIFAATLVAAGWIATAMFGAQAQAPAEPAPPLTLSPGINAPSAADAERPAARRAAARPATARQAVSKPAPARSSDPRAQVTDRANAGTVSIISGGVAGTYIRIAADIASVVDDGDRLRVLPMVGKGSQQNIRDIMFLRGVDLGLVQSDALENARKDPLLRDIAKQVAYVARLYNEEFHIIARNDIADVRQLEGKKVNIDLAASGTALTSRLFFERLGVKPQFVNLDQRTALEQLRSGEIDANIFVGGKPLQAVTEFRGDGRFRLLPLPYDPRLQDIYFPAEFTNADYRDLVPAGQSVETVAVATILAVYDWTPGSERYQRLGRFVDAFFTRFPEFAKPGRHPKWQEVNLSATVPGWRRFKPAEEWLARPVGAAQTDRAAFGKFIDDRAARGQAPLPAAEQERLFLDFQRWQRTQPAAR